MQISSLNEFETKISPERREIGQEPDRAIGRVLACNGARATIGTSLAATTRPGNSDWTIGRMLSIKLADSRLVALVYEMKAVGTGWDEQAENAIHVYVELLGEVIDQPGGKPRFQSGISNYPPIGAMAHRIRSSDLALVHDIGSRTGMTIGHVTQDPDLPAKVSIDDMLSRHFAVLGTTGVGKSSAVSLLLRRAIEAKPNLRVLILDPHNEYAHAFPDKALTIDAAGLDLPFWMFRFEEFADVVFRGRPPMEDEREILREVITAARARYRGGSAAAGNEFPRDLSSSTLLKRPLDAGVSRRGGDIARGGSDPLQPYRIVDVFAAIDEMVGLHEQRWPRAALRSLKVRIEALYADSRYQFMFARANMLESMAPVVAQIFRLPHHGRPICVFQLGGLPSEVVNAVASVLSRLAFDLAMASAGGFEVLLLCEESHRYVPSDPSLGFAPTRQAIARIAKEGRKYGCYLGVVTQRPGELDPTILSQCSTIFAMRLSNERDQQIIRSAIADASASTVAFLSAIGNREAIAFGEGIGTTMRMRFADLQPHELPAMAAAETRETLSRDPGPEQLVARLQAIGY